MKKVLSLTIALLATGIMFTACNDDDENENNDSNSSSTSEYFKEVATAFSIATPPISTFSGGPFNEEMNGYTYQRHYTLALYSDGSAILALETSYNGIASGVAGYYSTTYTQNNSTYTLGTFGGTYVGGKIYGNYVGKAGSLPWNITVSGNKITAVSLDENNSTNEIDNNNENQNSQTENNTNQNNQTENINNQSGNSTSTTIPNDIYLPTDWSSKNISAIFATATFNEGDGLNVGKYAIFFFTDGTWIETKKYVQTTYNVDGEFQEYPYEQNWSNGLYTLTGSFNNGNILLERKQIWMDGLSQKWYDISESETITITSGTFEYVADNNVFSLVSSVNNSNTTAPNMGENENTTEFGTTTQLSGKTFFGQDGEQLIFAETGDIVTIISAYNEPSYARYSINGPYLLITDGYDSETFTWSWSAPIYVLTTEGFVYTCNVNGVNPSLEFSLKDRRYTATSSDGSVHSFVFTENSFTYNGNSNIFSNNGEVVTVIGAYNLLTGVGSLIYDSGNLHTGTHITSANNWETFTLGLLTFTQY